MTFENSFEFSGVIVNLVKHSCLGTNKNSFYFSELLSCGRLLVCKFIVEDSENGVSSMVI